MQIGIDAAASEFYKGGKYDLDFKNPASAEQNWISAKQLSVLYNQIVAKYPIFLLEDPFDQDDWAAFKEYTAQATVQVGHLEIVIFLAENESAINKPGDFFLDLFTVHH